MFRKTRLSPPFLLSLPERAVRSLTALAGGLAREIGEVTVPGLVRRTRLYQSLVDSTLRFLIEQVGEVEGVYPGEDRIARNFLLRRTAGNGIEAAGIVAFRASPVWVMAALADLSGAGRQLIPEIAGALKQEGLLDAGARFESVHQMLDGLEQTAGRLAETFNTPPLDVASLREEWAALCANAARIPPKNLPSLESVRAAWRDLAREAEAQRRTVFELSTVLAISAASRLPDNLLRLSRAAGRAAGRSGRLLAGSVLDHYTSTLREIHQTGYAEYWAREFRPYLRAAADHFAPDHSTLTARLLKRFDTRRRTP